MVGAIIEGRWQVIGFYEKIFQVPGEAPRPGGCCEKCSAGIRYVVTLRDDDGRVMNVGRDCAVTLEGGPALAAIRNAEREWERSEYERLHGAERREREAERAAQRACQAQRNETDFAWTMAGLRLVVASESSSNWERDFAYSRLNPLEQGLDDFDIPDKEKAYLVSALANILSPQSEWVGTVGGKLELAATLEAIVLVGMESRFGPKRMHKLRASSGAVITWFASGSAGACREDVGKTYRIRGTVKEHSEYQGVKQTVMTRCKLVA